MKVFFCLLSFALCANLVAEPLPAVFVESPWLAARAAEIAGTAPDALAGCRARLEKLRPRLEAAFAKAQGSIVRERVFKRHAIALDTCAFVSDCLKKGDASSLQFAERGLDDLRKFESYFEEEILQWKSNPDNPANVPVRLSTRDFGTVGDGRTGENAAFARAFAAVRALGGRPCVLEIPAGDYLLAVEELDRPNWMKQQLTLCDLTNCVVTGAAPGRTRFICGVYDALGLRALRCRNVTFRDFSIEWAKTPFAEGFVVAVDPKEGSAVVEGKAEALRFDDPAIKGSLSTQWTPDGRECHDSSFAWMDAGRPAESLGGNRYRIYFNREKYGDSYTRVQTNRFISVVDRSSADGFNVFASSFVTLERLWCHTSRAAAFSGSGPAFTVNGLKVFPKKGFMMSTNADGVFTGPGSYVAHTTLTRMLDDGNNSHTYGAYVEDTVGERTFLYKVGNVPLPRKGELMLLASPLDGRYLGNVRVESACLSNRADRTRLACVTVESLPPGVESFRSLGMSAISREEQREIVFGRKKVDRMPTHVYLPGGREVASVVTDCRITSLRGTAIPIQSPNELIENVWIENIASGIRLCGLSQWMEGPPPYHVVVRDTVIRDCNTSLLSIFEMPNHGPAVSAPIRGCRFERVAVDNALWRGLEMQNLGESLFRDCSFTGANATLRLNRCENLRFEGCTKDGAPLSADDVKSESSGGISFARAEIPLDLDPKTGAIRGVRGCADGWRSGCFGLWQLTFRGGGKLCAADFATNAAWTVTREGDRFVYDSPKAVVRVDFLGRDGAVDIRGTVTAKTDDPAIELALPARMVFDSAAVDVFHSAERGKCGHGFAFNRKFFEKSRHYACEYPNLFLDFCQLDTVSGAKLAMYGVRTRPFVAGSYGVGGFGKGGYVDHAFRVWSEKGKSCETPVVRLAFGKDVLSSVADYAMANGLTRPLSEKIGAETLETLRKSPLCLAYGRGTEIAAECAAVPAPTLFHHSRYLKGGFDREYPDHLPSNEAKFGTDADHRAMIDALHAAGHLYSPYTNPTWWCDHPRGPTFLATGEAALTVDIDGKHIYEKYKNDGWTSCFWHPAVRAANRRTVDVFVKDLPCDLLFQDQVGARRCRWEFNPSAPSPLAYTEGLLRMAEEDAVRVPLATEDGWDRVANIEAVLCGCAWQEVPHTLDTNTWMSVLDRRQILADTFVYEPLTLYLMHDKCLFYLHDLSGRSDNDRILAWQIALGYNLSFVLHFPGWTRQVSGEPRRRWYGYIHDLQGKVMSRLAGKKLLSWTHDRAPLLSRTDIDPASGLDDGTVVAEWEGGIRVLANLGNVRRKVRGVWLAPYGYRVTGPGFEAAALLDRKPYVRDAEGTKEYDIPFEYLSATRPENWEEWVKLRTFVKSSKDGTYQPGFAWFPEKAKTEKVPLFVALHSWSFGYENLSPASWALSEAKKRGWAFYYPHFRGPNRTPQGCGSDLAVQDIVDGVEEVARRGQIDRDRIYLLGGSGGGHMALLMAGRHPEIWAGVYAACPISDVGRWHDESDDPARNLFPNYARMLESACGGTYAAQRAEYDRRSPVTHLARAKDVPIDIITGIHDGHKREKDGGSVPCGHAVRAFNCLAAEADRIPEPVIAEMERTERVPAAYAFDGEDPHFRVPERAIYLRRTSGNARLTLFNAGHSGNYGAAADWLALQRRGRPADWSVILSSGSATEPQAITK